MNAKFAAHLPGYVVLSASATLRMVNGVVKVKVGNLTAYYYRGHEIALHQDCDAGYYGRWTTGSFWGYTLNDCKAYIDSTFSK